jgi:hypothetical protein
MGLPATKLEIRGDDLRDGDFHPALHLQPNSRNCQNRHHQFGCSGNAKRTLLPLTSSQKPVWLVVNIFSQMLAFCIDDIILPLS